MYKYPVSLRNLRNKHVTNIQNTQTRNNYLRITQTVVPVESGVAGGVLIEYFFLSKSQGYSKRVLIQDYW